MTKEQATVLSIISDVISGNRTPVSFDSKPDWKAIYNELKSQDCICLAEPLLHSDTIPSDEKPIYEKTISVLQALYIKIISVQNKLCEILNKSDIHYVIIKGLSTAQFYSDPLLRVPGDIDFFVDPDQFDITANLLTQAGFSIEDSSGNRHMIFNYGGITVEMHRRFSLAFDSEKLHLLDTMIQKEAFSPVINTVMSASFPSVSISTCGLIILEHANQHSGEGLGLRHLVDWAVFVQNELTSHEKWDSFYELAKQLGLERLMCSLTQTCQLYLGLTDSIHCPKESNINCSKLIEYIFESGNNGKNDSLGNSITAVLINSRKDSGFLKSLQKNGKENWKLLEKHSWLTPFAWAYQLKRYIAKALQNDGSIRKSLTKAAIQAKTREQLLRELGVTCRVK